MGDAEHDEVSSCIRRVGECTIFELSSGILSRTVEFSGQVVSRFQRNVSDGKTAYDRRKQKRCRKALVPFGELVMFMPMENPRTRVRSSNRVGIMLGLVVRSDEVVVGTTERVVKVHIVHRMPVGKRGDAMYAKSIRGVPWQPNPAEAAEGEALGMARIVSVPVVPIEYRLAVPVVEREGVQSSPVPRRREVEFVKFGHSND